MLNSLGVLLGSSWSSGVNLYLTIAGLGIAQRMGWVNLPGNMSAVSHPLIIILALVLYCIEFFADKIPYVDSMWDSVHTFIRPVGGAVLGYMATSNMGPVFQIPIALLTGSVAADSHLTKATARVVINSSPEPITNSIASIGEDASVVGILYLIAKHPVIAFVAVILFVIFSVWFLKKMFRFLKKVFSSSGSRKDNLYAETNKV